MRVAALIVVLVTLAIYVPVLSAGWVYEDHNWIGALGTEGIWRWPGRTLTTVTYSWQADHLPRSFHAVQVGLHLVVGLLAWIWARRIGLTGALVGTAIFLWHPVNSQAVSYLSARTDVLMALWTLVALISATWRHPLGVLGALIACVFAAGSKEMGLVSVVLVAAVWMASLSWRWQVLLGTSAAGLIGWYALQVPQLLGAWPSWQAWLEMASANTTLIWRWWALMVVPVGLSIDPDPWAVSLPMRMAGIGLLIGLTGWAVTRVPWMVGMIAVVLLPRILLPTYDPIMEHHLYLAMIPLCLWLGSQMTKGTRWASY